MPVPIAHHGLAVEGHGATGRFQVAPGVLHHRAWHAGRADALGLERRGLPQRWRRYGGHQCRNASGVQAAHTPAHVMSAPARGHETTRRKGWCLPQRHGARGTRRDAGRLQEAVEVAHLGPGRKLRTVEAMRPHARVDQAQRSVAEHRRYRRCHMQDALRLVGHARKARIRLEDARWPDVARLVVDERRA